MYVDLPAMFGPGQEDERSQDGGSRCVSFGNERAARVRDFEDRVAALLRSRARVTRRRRAGSSCSRERRSRDRRRHRSRAISARRSPAAWLGLGGDLVAQREEQVVLEVAGVLVGLEDLALERLELVGDVPLGVLRRLLADVVGGELGVLVRGRDLDVVAEDLVEADSSGSRCPSARPRAPGSPAIHCLLSRLEREDLVELGVEAAADQSALLDRDRWVLDQGRADPLAMSSIGVESVGDGAEPAALGHPRAS